MQLKTQYITQCPRCDKKQQATPAEFSLAAGKIFCLKCQCLFDAKMHRQESASLSLAMSNVHNNKFKAFNALHADIRKPKKTMKKTLLNSLIGLLLCALLIGAIGQLAYFNRTQWSKIESLEYFYEKLKPWFFRNSPINSAFTQISFAMTTDPTYQNIMTIDFSFQNNSAISQRPPAIELTFTDLKGHLVSQRTFQPDSYLTTAALEKGNIPPDAIISAQLSVMKTANRALNHRIELLKADK